MSSFDKRTAGLGTYSTKNSYYGETGFGKKRVGYIGRRYEGQYSYYTTSGDEYSDRLSTDLLADRPRTLKYLKENPNVAEKFWFNRIIAQKINQNPSLLDSIENDPPNEIARLIASSQPPPPPKQSSCCSIL